MPSPPQDDVLRRIREEHQVQMRQMEEFQAEQRREIMDAARQLSEQQAEIESAARNQQQQNVQVNQFASQLSEGMNRQFADMRAQLDHQLAVSQDSAPTDLRRKGPRTSPEPAATAGRYVQESEAALVAQPQPQWQPTLAALPQVMPSQFSGSGAASTGSWEVTEPQQQPSLYQISTPALENRVLPDVDDSSDLEDHS
jgi:DNA polymerase III gamma/tau subunit